MSSASNSAARAVRRLAADRSGVTSLEWALVSATFLLLIISVFDLVRYVVVLQSVASVVTEAGRACLIDASIPICGGGSPVSWTTLSAVAPLLDSAQVTLNVVTGAGANGSPYGAATPLGMNVVQVTVSYPYTAWMPWLSSLNATISETAIYFN